ncbi:MAG: hypothetical protein Q8928_08900 [Bacteroidota bacterium]|nr:hypothetical protein [Bacteroidota bacterium]
MTDKFDIKDYINYSISGLIWILIITKYLISVSVLQKDIVIEFLKTQNAVVYVTILLLLGSYILGNLLRFTEKILIGIANLLWGDLYSSALFEDREKYTKASCREKILKLGLCFYLFNKKPLAIGKKSSNAIETNLNKLKINNSSKKNQHILSETYLLLNYSNLKYQRLKDLKNLYESISFPFFIVITWGILNLIYNDSIMWYNKSFIILLLIYIVCQFISRYKFLKANYIKDVYRYFLFYEEKDSKKN